MFKIASYDLKYVLDSANFYRQIGDTVVKSLHRNWIGQWSITLKRGEL